MAESKKKKSIYSYKLKDVNKDGKKNFGDTWLGDALGFDGKIGTQGPGMKKSMKGARRQMGEDKTASDESSTTSSKPSKTTRPPKGRPTEPKFDAGDPRRRRAKTDTPKFDAGDPRRRGNVKPSTKSTKPEVKSTPASAPVAPSVTKKETKGVTYAQWKEMSRSERKAKGLPETTTGWQYQKLSGKDKNTSIGANAPDSNSSSNNSNTGKRAGRKSGMAKGGMARFQQNGTRDYKESGMFYKSGSPKGYK